MDYDTVKKNQVISVYNFNYCYSSHFKNTAIYTIVANGVNSKPRTVVWIQVNYMINSEYYCVILPSLLWRPLTQAETSFTS